MWRTARHKLILRMKRTANDDASTYTAHDIVGGEFYDLTNDPQEWHDLYSNPETDRKTLETMTEDLLAFLGTLERLT